jgi:hypothetical protein
MSLVLLLAAAALHKRKVASRVCFWLAVAVLLETMCSTRHISIGKAKRPA